MVDKEFIIEAMLKKRKYKEGGFIAGVIDINNPGSCRVHINYPFKPGPNGEFFELVELSKLQEEDFSLEVL